MGFAAMSLGLEALRKVEGQACNFAIQSMALCRELIILHIARLTPSRTISRTPLR